MFDREQGLAELGYQIDNFSPFFFFFLPCGDAIYISGKF